ncbi:zinc-dependent metalloprotease [Sinomicrobium weinanense]|nr:zinc-dependent metalloprotease [Sinomicrobium weinanense]
MHVQGQEKDEKNEKEKDSSDTSKLKKYSELLEGGTLQEGIFNIIRNKKDYYFEIPDSLMGREFLVVNKISRVPLQLNEAGLNKGMEFENKVITFEKDTLREKIWVRTLVPMVSSPGEDAITNSVKNNFSSSIVEAFDIASKNKKGASVVIKVNKVFNGKEQSFNDVLNNTGLGGSVKSGLSYIVGTKAFPRNVMIKSDLSTSVSEGGASLPITIRVACNIVLLPREPMQPRFLDKRVGYFSKKRWYFNDEQHAMEERKLITRWRLEPRAGDRERYLSGELVEPKDPIVFYIDPSTPKKWRDYIKQGVFDWQVAFEQAGFKNAVIAKEPTGEDADFDIDDVRYSVITYAASPKSNAMGPSVVDPRSGEILEADIIWWHNVMISLHSWMRIQTGAIDEKSRSNTFNDQHMGEAVRFVSSHEVGHTFGLKHNMGASYAFEVDSLRSRTFTDKMGGTAPSIMDYARYNYVAQPEDHLKAITPSIGIYDKYAIQWGYRWFDDRSKEEKYLKELVSQHNNDPLYFYGEQQDYKHTIDPRSQSEDLGNDAVRASQYGIKNLKRVLAHVLDWTYEEGDSYYKSGKLYMGIIGQWQLYNNHVLNNVGGVYLNTTVHGDGKRSYEPVAYDMQKKAVSYLNNEVFTFPGWLFVNDILEKTFPLKDSPLGPYEYSPYTLARELQYSVLYSLFQDDRLLRLLESGMYASDQGKKFTVNDLFDQTRNHVFAKTMKNKSLDTFERMTQKNYVDVLIVDINKLFEKTSKKSLQIPASLQIPTICNHVVNSGKAARNINFTSIKRVSEVTSVKKGELRTLLRLLQKKKNKGDRDTRMHYQDLINRIEEAINN